MFDVTVEITAYNTFGLLETEWSEIILELS